MKHQRDKPFVTGSSINSVSINKLFILKTNKNPNGFPLIFKFNKKYINKK